MGASTDLSPVVRGLLETLVATSDASLRARILVEAVLATGAARAVALWRRPAADSAGWRQVLARGTEDALPPAEQVTAALEGALDARLPGRRLVLGPVNRGAALALGDVGENEDAIDLAHGILLAWSSVDEAESSEALDLPSAPFGRSEAGAGDGAPGILEDALAPPAPEPPPRSADTGSAGLAHDLRNILAGIRSTLDVLEGPTELLNAEERVRFEGTVSRECSRASELLLALVGAPAPLPAQEPWSGVLSDVLRAEEPRCAASGVRLEVEVDRTCPPCALEATALARVVGNLVSNAREAFERAGRSGGRVRVELLPGPGPGGGLVLRVEDDGPGVDSTLAPRVFERGVSSKEGDAHGLGLAVVQELVARAGGSVRWRNVPRGGARFELWLPNRPLANDPRSPLRKGA